VTWRRQGDAHPLTIGLYPFAPDSRLSVDYNQRTNEWSLIIQDVTPRDEGVYHCQVTSKDDQDNMYNVHLYVASTSCVDTVHPAAAATENCCLICDLCTVSRARDSKQEQHRLLYCLTVFIKTKI